MSERFPKCLIAAVMASQDDISDLEVDSGQGVHLPQGAQASQASASAAQNPFSPGSLQAQGMYVTPDDMMTMMRQMMEATTAAATAAQAALSAATSQGNAKQGIAGSDMARILPKPDVFKPAADPASACPVRLRGPEAAHPAVSADVENAIAWHLECNHQHEPLQGQ